MNKCPLEGVVLPGPVGIQGRVFLVGCNSFFFSYLPLHALCFFPSKGQVFLLQESCCNIALLSTLVVTYIVVCVAMLTQPFLSHALAQQDFLCPRIPLLL